MSKKFFIFHCIVFFVYLICFIVFNINISAEVTETTEITETTETTEISETTIKISNFDIKDLSSYIDSEDYVVSYCYKGNNKGNYIIYPYDDLYTFKSNNYNPFYTKNGYYLYNINDKSFSFESIVFGGYDWRNHDTYIIGSTYNIKNKDTGDIVFFKTMSNDNIMAKDITSGTIYNNFFFAFKPVLLVVLPIIILILAFYKCWGWIRGILQGL